MNSEFKGTTIDFANATAQPEGGLLVPVVAVDCLFTGWHNDLASVARSIQGVAQRTHTESGNVRFSASAEDHLVVRFGTITRVSPSACVRRARYLRKILVQPGALGPVRIQFTTPKSAEVQAWDPDDELDSEPYVSANLEEGWYKRNRTGAQLLITNKLPTEPELV